MQMLQFAAAVQAKLKPKNNQQSLDKNRDAALHVCARVVYSL
jgi:hypothetical protein